MTRCIFLLMVLAVTACNKNEKVNSFSEINWKAKAIDMPSVEKNKTLERGTSYLSVYPLIFNVDENKIQALTATVSLRNTSVDDTLYVSSARYYNTKGEMIRVYFDFPIQLMPLETDHIIINHTDNSGGTGANFVFEWAKMAGTTDPIFEAVMLSTYGQQGISFTTQGVRIK